MSPHALYVRKGSSGLLNTTPVLQAYFGAVDTLRLVEEARACFISGHFVASVLLSTSFVEHTLADEFNELDLIKGKPTLEYMIKLAREHLGLPSDLLHEKSGLEH